VDDTHRRWFRVTDQDDVQEVEAEDVGGISWRPFTPLRGATADVDGRVIGNVASWMFWCPISQRPQLRPRGLLAWRVFRGFLCVSGSCGQRRLLL
jgi:hypothetical protein